MRSLNLYIQSLILICLLFSIGCKKNALYSGDVPERDTTLAPFPVDTIVVPDMHKSFLHKVKQFEEEDKDNKIEVGEVLFLGNGILVDWSNVQSYFEDDKIYNRAIEGVTASAVQFFSNRIATPYEPSHIFLYLGEVELGDQQTVSTTFTQVRNLMEDLRYNLPNSEISYISLLHTPTNAVQFANFKELNDMISNYIQGKDKRAYLDLNKVLITSEGNVDPIYFESGKLNALGYQKLADVIKDKIDEGKPQISTYMEFDGSTNYVHIPHHEELDINLGESITITFWERVENHNGARFITKRDGNGYEIVANGSGLLAVNLRGKEGNLGTSYAPAAFSINDNQWHHVTYVYDQTGAQKIAKVYLDGVLITESQPANIKTTDQDLSVPTADFVIGTQSSLTGAKLKGAIDNIRIYKRALSETEIHEDKNTLKLTDLTGVVAIYDFEDIVDNVLENKAANKHHGTISGNIKTNQRIVQ